MGKIMLRKVYGGIIGGHENMENGVKTYTRNDYKRRKDRCSFPNQEIFSRQFRGQEGTVHHMEHRRDEFHVTLEEPLLMPGTTVGAQQVRIWNHYTLCYRHESNKQNRVKTRKHNLHVKKALIGKNNNTGIFVVNDNLSLQFIHTQVSSFTNGSLNSGLLPNPIH